MSEFGPFRVKCEPPSDGEDSNSHYPHNFTTNQLNTQELISVKVEAPEPAEENVSSHILHHLQVGGVLELAPPAPAAPAATPVRARRCPPPRASPDCLETLEPARADTGATLLDRHIHMLNASEVDCDFAPLLSVKDEPLSEGEQQQCSDEASECSGTEARGSPKGWSARDMERALQALRDRRMSLTKDSVTGNHLPTNAAPIANTNSIVQTLLCSDLNGIVACDITTASATYGIPSTTLWQRAHRLGIDTPKKDGAAKSWSDGDLRAALHALRAGALSANKASKAYGIPSSTLYKIARREGIRLAAPFNAAPTSWRRGDLQRALAAIRCGAASVQRAAAQYGIPTGTLYGRCKREGIELSRSNPTPWSEDAMGEALEAVRVGQMSINQAAIHFNLPYSSLYGRFKRCKYQLQGFQTNQTMEVQNTLETEQQTQQQNQESLEYYNAMPLSNDDYAGLHLPYSQLLAMGDAHEHALYEQCGPGLYHAQGCHSGVATS